MKKILIAIAILAAMNSCTKDGNTGYVGPNEIKVENGQMTSETLLAFGRVSDPQLSPDKSKILYGVSYTSVKENRSCRNLFMCNTDGSGKVQLTRYAKSVSNARWSLDGKTVYFIQGGQIYKAALKGTKLGKKIAISNVPEGISEFKLSADQTKVLYVSTVPGPVKGATDVDPSLDKAKAFIAEDLMYRHWDHWVTETPRTYVADFGNEIITKENSKDILEGENPNFELPTEPFGGAEQLDWCPDGKHIAYSCRKLTGKEYAFSTNTCIYIYDVCTGESTAVTTNGGYDTDPVWSPDGSHLAWISMERDGYEADRQRLMVADVANGCEVSNIRELAPGLDADASGIFWSNCGTKIFFNATVKAIGAIYRVKLENGDLTRFTPENWWYGFGPAFGFLKDGDSRKLLCTYQSMEFPTEIASVTIGHDIEPEVVNISHENDHILNQLNKIGQERIVLKSSNGDDLPCWVLYPPQFDENKVYPAVEMLNGGPQTSLDQSWSYRWNFALMAQSGYVVILPNRHGDSGFGQAFKEQISGDYPGVNMKDYMIAGQYLKDKKYVGKIGAIGASYGGYSAYMLEGLHGDLYDCIISHAGIFDEENMWYTTEEMWFANWDNGGLKEYSYTPGEKGPRGDGITFGGMQQAGAPYANTAKTKNHYSSSPESKVTSWKTPLMCIHGMMDFRIPYTQGMAAFNAAQMMGVPSKLVVFPEENHWILQPQNSLLWHKEVYDWLDKWLKD